MRPPRDHPVLSIIVCTYNRAAILLECMESLAGQSVDPDNYEVLIIDNNSTDETRASAVHFISENKNFMLFSEPIQGLSHARNRGWRESRTEWIAYIDDDAKAPRNFVEQILSVIDRHDFDCFGGRYVPWYKYGKPPWYKDEYGSSALDQTRAGILEKGYLSGGVMVIKKSVLVHFGGFPHFLGMKGDVISYGEETYLQTKLRGSGYRIGYDPDLVIEHLVPAYKMRVGWFLFSAFSRGKVSWTSVGKHATLNNFYGLFKIMFYDAARTLVPCTTKLLRDDYYWENWIIDVVGPQVKNTGILIGGMHTMLCRSKH